MTGSKPHFKFDPQTQAQEASLLRDLISTESQSRFHQQNIPELKVEFSARKQGAQKEQLFD